MSKNGPRKAEAGKRGVSTATYHAHVPYRDHLSRQCAVMLEVLKVVVVGLFAEVVAPTSGQMPYPSRRFSHSVELEAYESSIVDSRERNTSVDVDHVDFW